MIPGLPGFFIIVIKGVTDSAAVKIFQIYYFIGFPLGLITYVALAKIFPPAGLGEKVLMGENQAEQEISVIEGEGIEVNGDKSVAVCENKKVESDSM
jgi:NCS1 family nucleobase:cation symporter-1